MRVVSTTGADVLLHAGAEFTADEHGIFEVPEHVGTEICAFPTWVPEHVAAAQALAEQQAADADPSRALERLSALESRVADLEARLAEQAEGDEVEKPKRGRAAKAAEPETAE